MISKTNNKKNDSFPFRQHRLESDAEKKVEKMQTGNIAWKKKKFRQKKTRQTLVISFISHTCLDECVKCKGERANLLKSNINKIHLEFLPTSYGCEVKK